jgi:hypothetical protein
MLPSTAVEQQRVRALSPLRPHLRRLSASALNTRTSAASRARCCPTRRAVGQAAASRSWVDGSVALTLDRRYSIHQPQSSNSESARSVRSAPTSADSRPLLSTLGIACSLLPHPTCCWTGGCITFMGGRISRSDARPSPAPQALAVQIT